MTPDPAYEWQITSGRDEPPPGEGWEVMDAGICGCRWRRAKVASGDTEIERLSAVGWWG